MEQSTKHRDPMDIIADLTEMTPRELVITTQGNIDATLDLANTEHSPMWVIGNTMYEGLSALAQPDEGDEVHANTAMMMFFMGYLIGAGYFEVDAE